MSTHSIPVIGRWRREATSPQRESASRGGRFGRRGAPVPAGGSRVPEVPPAPRTSSTRSRLGRLVRGHETGPVWARPALLALLVATAVLYFWNLTASGYANEFYAAAVKSASVDWKAWLFGSLDSANAITVDKPPAALWVMGLSARIFGFSSFSLLAPQALMGVGTVAVTAAAVRRWHGHAAALVAGALVALTPAAALMFKFDNPDALLTLLMAGAAYAVVRAVDTDRRKAAAGWMVAAGVALGFAFLTKMLQGLLVLPAFGLAYLVAARWSVWARVRHLLAATLALIAGAGWFVALVSLWPADSRPYIGGSTNNSEWELALGYNGLGRILGGEGNGGGGGGGMGGGANSGFGGTKGILRMVNTAFGGEISWLLPAALLLLVAGLIVTLRRPRTDRTRASLIVWGGWMVVTAVVFSFMSGTVHPYYAIALAPAIAATIAVGAHAMWVRRSRLLARVVLGVAIAATGVWAFALLRRDAAGWQSWIAWVAIIGATLGAMGYVALGTEYEPGGRRRVRRAATIALLVGSLASVSGTAAWTVATATSAHNGSIPTAGPAIAGQGMGGPGGAGQGRPPTGQSGNASGGTGTTASGNSSSAGTTGQAPSGTSQAGGQAATGEAPAATSGQPPTMPGTGGQSGTTQSGTTQSGTTGQADGQNAGSMGGPGGGMGSSTNTALISLLDAAGTRWSAAVIGDQSAAGYILSSDTAVMSLGGWSGSDDNVTLAQFQQYVADGQIHYFIAGGGMGGPGGGGPDGQTSSTSQISEWVQAHFTATTVGGVTVYDLTQQAS